MTDPEPIAEHEPAPSQTDIPEAVAVEEDPAAVSHDEDGLTVQNPALTYAEAFPDYDTTGHPGFDQLAADPSAPAQ